MNIDLFEGKTADQLGLHIWYDHWIFEKSNKGKKKLLVCLVSDNERSFINIES